MNKMIKITISMFLLACFSMASLTTYTGSIKLNESEIQSSYSEESSSIDGSTNKLIKFKTLIVEYNWINTTAKLRFLAAIKRFHFENDHNLIIFLSCYGTRATPFA